MTMDISRFPVAGAALLRPARQADHRGWLCEAYSARAWAELGLHPHALVQDNETFSPLAGTLRGLHFQRPPRAQGKVLRVPRGAAYVVGVDLRAGSPTYGAHVAAMLDEENGAQLWTPPGFAHGLVTQAPNTLVQYKVTAPFAPDHVGGLAWDDPALAIDWPAPGPSVFSDRDLGWPPLAGITPLAC